MAITRQTTEPLASAELNDQYGVDLTVHSGREKLTRALTAAEAMLLSDELARVSRAAQRAAAEDGES